MIELFCSHCKKYYKQHQDINIKTGDVWCCEHCFGYNIIEGREFNIDNRETTTKGTKFDQGKPRFDLIPVVPLEGLAALYGLGAAKYQDNNWRKGFKWSRIFSAMMRHAWAWWRGEKFDLTDGQHHLLAVAWGAFALYEHERCKLGEDDRVIELKGE